MPTPSNLNPKEVSQWMREQAKRLNQMATDLDATFSNVATSYVAVPHLSPSNIAIVPGSEVYPVSPAEIKSVIKLRGMRVGDLAHHFGTTPDVIHAVIDSDLELTIAERGWVKFRERI